MVIIRLTDRLGNQLFQYAAAKSLAVRNNTLIKIDKSYYDDPLKKFHYQLDAFELPQEFATSKEVYKYGWPSDSLFCRILRKIFPKYGYFEKSCYDKNFLKLKDKVYLRGFWQSYKYFEDIETIIRRDFTFKNPINKSVDLFAKKILETNSVCVSVRRGDHITNPEIGKKYGQCDIQYYNQALEIVCQREKEIELFIFSDDIDWCIENMRFDLPVTFVKQQDKKVNVDYYLQLMSFCRHFIIPVSTFHWWGAWLSTYKNKIVIAPRKWFSDPNISTNDLCPPDWIRI